MVILLCAAIQRLQTFLNRFESQIKMLQVSMNSNRLFKKLALQYKEGNSGAVKRRDGGTEIASVLFQIIIIPLT